MGFLLTLACVIIIKEYDLIKSFIGYASLMRSYRAYGNLVFLQNADFSSIYQLIIFMPLSLMFIILAPFPWQLTSVSNIVTLPEMLVYYLILVFSIKGFAYLRRERIRGYGVLSMIILFILVTLAIFEGNMGTVFRHRVVMLPFLFILSAIGFNTVNKNIKC